MIEVSPNASVTLDGSGNGQVSLGPPSGTVWRLRLANVSTTGSVKQPQAFLYRGSTSGPLEQIDSTYLGNSASSGKVAGAPFYAGQVLWAKWTGGDAGAVATLQAYGQQGRREELPFDSAAPVGEGFALSVATVFQAGTTVINGSGEFVYSGPPALGDLIASIAGAGGTDAEANAYVAGVAAYDGGGGFIQLHGSSGQAFIVMSPSGAVHLTAFPELFTTAQNPGAVNERYEVQLTTGTAGGHGQAALVLDSDTADGSGIAFARMFIGNTALVTLDKIAFMLGTGTANEQWVFPSGDTSGATDAANLNGALAATSHVRLLPGTYYVNAVIEFPGGATITGASPQVTIIRATAAMNAVLASTGWNGSLNTTSQSPVHLSGFRADANGNATYGIVSQNFWSYFTDLECTNATADGFRFDAFGANGTTVFGPSVTAVENHVMDCQFRSNTGAGFRTHDEVAHQHFTDGWLTDCVVQGPGSSGTVAIVQIDVLAGWRVTGNHLYGAAVNAMSGQRMFNTRVENNYIEPWGTSATSGGYAGMSFDGIADEGFGASVIANNTLNVDATSPGNAASTIDGIFCRVTSGNSGGLSITGNTISNPEPVAAKYKAAFDLQTQSATATLNVVTTGNQVGSGWTAGVLLTANGGTINHTAGV